MHMKKALRQLNWSEAQKGFISWQMLLTEIGKIQAAFGQKVRRCDFTFSPSLFSYSK